MSEVTINERLKFLIEKYGMSVRAFSTAIGATDTNTRNYIDRGSKPNAEYLGKLLKRFNDINPTWLLLGEGEPFLPDSAAPDQSTTTNVKKNAGAIQNNTGNAQVTNNIKLEECKRDLEASRKDAAAYQREIALLQGQLKDKEEIITLLRVSYNRPN
jgi:hypothetical protein